MQIPCDMQLSLPLHLHPVVRLLHQVVAKQHVQACIAGLIQGPQKQNVSTVELSVPVQPGVLGVLVSDRSLGLLNCILNLRTEMQQTDLDLNCLGTLGWLPGHSNDADLSSKGNLTPGLQNKHMGKDGVL